MSDDPDDHWEAEWDDETGEGSDDCQQTPDGFCQLDGTEWCDECPYNIASDAHERREHAALQNDPNQLELGL